MSDIFETIGKLNKECEEQLNSMDGGYEKFVLNGINLNGRRYHCRDYSVCIQNCRECLFTNLWRRRKPGEKLYY